MPSPGTGSIGTRPVDPSYIQQPVITQGTPITGQPAGTPALLPAPTTSAPMAPGYTAPGVYTPPPAGPSTMTWPPASAPTTGVPVGNPYRGMAPSSGYSMQVNPAPTNSATAPSYAAPSYSTPGYSGGLPATPAGLSPNGSPPPVIASPPASPAPTNAAPPGGGPAAPGYLPQDGFNYREGAIRQPGGDSVARSNDPPTPGVAIDGATVTPPPIATTATDANPIRIPAAVENSPAVTPASATAPSNGPPEIGDLPLRREGMAAEPER